ncbi:hypothetical protein AAG906_018611 [Vitis piasezkii]
MKLNLAKCAFGISAGKFLRFMELQRLIGRQASFERFIACFTSKLRPFFLTLNGASTEYEIKYQPRLSWKGQIMADFTTELPKKQAHPTDHPGEQWWTLHADKMFRVSGFRVGLILQSPTGELMVRAIRLNFFANNNEAEYEVILARPNLILVLTAIKLEIRSDSQLIVG